MDLLKKGNSLRTWKNSGLQGDWPEPNTTMGLSTIRECFSLSLPKDICPSHHWAQAGPALFLEAACLCTNFVKVEPMWSLPLWVTCFQTEVCPGSMSHVCLQLQEWLGKFIPELYLGELLTLHKKNSLNMGWVVKGDKC